MPERIARAECFRRAVRRAAMRRGTILCGQGMDEQDWIGIERQLLGAYQTLKAAVAAK